jgi:hypothetical protein
MDGDGDGSKEPLPSVATSGVAMGAATAEESRPQSTVAGLAKEAAQLFHARSYQGCLLILHQLQLHNDEDPKVSPANVPPPPSHGALLVLSVVLLRFLRVRSDMFLGLRLLNLDHSVVVPILILIANVVSWSTLGLCRR